MSISKITSFLCYQCLLYLYFLCPGIDPFPQQPPARQAVAVVTEISLILATDIDGNDCSGTHVSCNVGCWMCNTSIHKRARSERHSKAAWQKPPPRRIKRQTTLSRKVSVSVNTHWESHNVSTDLHHKAISLGWHTPGRLRPIS